MAWTPPTSAHHGHRLGKSRRRLALPGRRTHRHGGRAEQTSRHPGHHRVPGPHGWGRPRRRVITPLPRGLAPPVRPGLRTRRRQLPAPDTRGPDLDRGPLGGRRRPRVGGNSPGPIAKPHPAQGPHGLAGMLPDGRVGGALDAPRPGAVPVGPGHRGPGRPRSREDRFAGGPPRPRVARPPVLPRRAWGGGRIARRVPAPAGDDTPGRTHRSAPCACRLGRGARHDPRPGWPPAPHQPDGVPRPRPPRVRSTASRLVLARRGGTHGPQRPRPRPPGCACAASGAPSAALER
jgi:hypothetical protein